jgi:hypothetical protein
MSDSLQNSQFQQEQRLDILILVHLQTEGSVQHLTGLRYTRLAQATGSSVEYVP